MIPDLKGKFDGVAIRVPTPTVSLIDLVMNVENEVKLDSLKEAFLEYEHGRGQGILQYSEEPLVSMDLKGDEHSTIVDGTMCQVLDKTLLKVFAWYDNEWGYSCRVADLANMVAKKSR